MSGKHQFDGKLVQEVLDSGGVHAVALEKVEQRTQRAALWRGMCGSIMLFAPPDAVLLFGSVDKVEIDGEGADYINGGGEIALFHHVGNFSIQRLDLFAQARQLIVAGRLQ